MVTNPIYILLVEDNPGDARLVKEIISDAISSKIHITCAENLKEAIEILSHASIDVILLDLGLPDSSGFETFEKISHRFSTVPIIALTGNADEVLNMRILREGGQDYLTKNDLNNNLLIRAISQAIQRHKLLLKIENDSKALREGERLKTTIINSTKEAVISINQDGLITLFNPSAENMFQRNKSDVLGKSLDILMPENYREQHKESIAHYFHSEHSDLTTNSIMELSALKSDGTIFPIEVSLSGFKDGINKFIVGVIRDISERKKAEAAQQKYAEQIELANQKLKDANNKLRELDKLKSEFLSVASHELRTPLTIIKEYVSLIRDGVVGAINAEQRECLDSTLKNCIRLGNLINDILDLQRIESGLQKLNRKKENINKIVDDCIMDFQTQCKAKNLSLVFKADNDVPSVLCDYSKITQVLVNLLGNACKFTPEGGNITVATKMCENGTKSVIVSVKDNGPGISEDDQVTLFDKFTQFNRENGAGSKGTGLGLAIAKNIVNLHNGQINVNSQVGQGSDFCFSLPVYSEINELISFIGDRLSLASANNTQLSAYLIKADLSSHDARGEDCIDNYYQLLNNNINRTLRRKDDEVLFLKEQRLLAISVETDQAGVVPFKCRLEEILSSNGFESESVLLTGGLVPKDIPVREWILETSDNFKRLSTINSSKKVLVIDDEDIILDVIANTLDSSSLNLKIETSNDGYNGSLLIGEIKPDLVILDINMPCFDGTKVLKYIKQSNRCKSTKVIVVSGFPERIQEFEKLGADEFLAKPINPKKLIEKVKTLLSQDELKTIIGLPQEHLV